MLLKLGKIILFSTTVVVVTLWTILWLRDREAFYLNKISVEGNRLVSKRELLELASVDMSQEIFDVDLNALENRLGGQTIFKKVSVRRNLPSSLKISVQERNLIAVVSASRLYGVDNEGYLLDGLKPKMMYDLPLITGARVRTDSAGNKIPSRELQKAVSFLTKVQEIDFNLYHQISELNVNASCGIVLYLMGNATPVILGRDQLHQKIYYLSAAVKKLEEKKALAHIKYLDLRFDNQVVVKGEG